MDPFATLPWKQVRRQYERRCGVHEELLDLLERDERESFVHLVLGIENPAGNYSAAEHGLGPQVLRLNRNAIDRVFELCQEFHRLEDPHEVPVLIRNAGLRYLQIGVGSEASCLVNPEICWVSNTRTIWTHLVVKHDDNLEKANEELELYRSDQDSEMAYKVWAAIHRELDTAMTRIAERASRLATQAGVQPGGMKYLWADAVANQLYSEHS
jgi:hypothetical protein